MAYWDAAQDELNALKNKYHLTWCFEFDLPDAGGILWYKPNGACIAVFPQNPVHALPEMKRLIAEQNIQVPTYCKPLNKMVMLQGVRQPGLEAHCMGKLGPDSTKFLPEDAELEYDTYIPVEGHPGAFGAVRKNHVHEGVDLYANNGDRVYAMVPGKVVAIIEDFTGPGCGMPWWNQTSAIAIEDANGVWIYGEIVVGASIKVGDEIKAGTDIGGVKQVLKEDKGRPMSMLHLERYTVGTTESVGIWELNTPQPTNLLDPTPELVAGLLFAGTEVE